jgi:hypothetical protein
MRRPAIKTAARIALFSNPHLSTFFRKTEKLFRSNSIITQLDAPRESASMPIEPTPA